ncbi:MAG TPA: hypothetical protein VGO91_17515 [Pyrinomonadaceae bacterium]|nr:hypothetical protein [Pyrinomonadaceae bacterium]
MKNRLLSGCHVRRVMGRLVIAVALVSILSQAAWAASWNNIEPLKSRRADVERILGRPINTEQPGTSGTLRFKVMGGIVTITFVTARFIANKKLYPELEGSVLEIVLQHEHSTDTPESMGLTKNSDFKRQDAQGGSIFLNQKEGITYTFVGGQLKTTRYSPAAQQLAHARKG